VQRERSRKCQERAENSQKAVVYRKENRIEQRTRERGRKKRYARSRQRVCSENAREEYDERWQAGGMTVYKPRCREEEEADAAQVSRKHMA